LALLKLKRGGSVEVRPVTGEERVIPRPVEDKVVRNAEASVVRETIKKEELHVENEQALVGERVSDIQKVKDEWHDFLSNLAHANASLAGLLRSAAPLEMDEKYLTLEVFYPFHKDQLDQDAKKKVIEAAIARVWGPLTVKCILGSKEGRLSQSQEVKPVMEAVVNEVALGETPAKQDTVAGNSAEEIFGV